MDDFQADVLAFLEELNVTRHLAVNTIEAYRSDLAQYMTYLQDYAGCADWLHVDELTVRKYFYWIRDHGSAEATIARKVTAVRRFHHFLIQIHRRPDDPTFSVHTTKREPHPLAILTYPQVERLLAAPDITQPIGCRDAAMLELLYATGMHVSELIQLNIADLSIELGFVRCRGRKGNERIIPFGSKAASALNAYISARPFVSEQDDQPLFINRQRRRFSRQGIWKLLKRYAVSCGITQTLSPETLRQSLAVHLIENGADLLSVETLMGRTSSAAMQRFDRLDKPSIKDFYRLYHPRA
ncbi:MAG: tyrosine-type recombinase/integrase [Sporolactobacillus sp.]